MSSALTFSADPEKGGALTLYAPPIGCRFGRRGGIKGTPDKIGNLSAIAADQMVMPLLLQAQLETGLAFRGLNPGDQSMFFKGRQGPVDGIEGKGGQSFQQPGMQGLGGGMISGQGQFAKDFQSLLGNFQTSMIAFFLESRKLLIISIFFCFHHAPEILLLDNNYYLLQKSRKICILFFPTKMRFELTT